VSISPGTRLDRYEVMGLVGAGGMGEVYRARDTRLDRNVAVKLLPPAFAADASRMRRFIREAKAASALNHPNILIVHEIGESGERPFIVTEFIEGVTLRQRLAEGPCALPLALDVAIQVNRALSAAHAAGVIHRDIKPENIMIRPDGVVKVLDFGLARMVTRGTGSDTQVSSAARETDAITLAWATTGPGVMLGTTGYMSPEQARGREVDERSDVFSCGVVLYEMLAGEPPFPGETASDRIAALLSAEPRPIDDYVPTAPPELRRMLMKALSKERSERYQTTTEFLADLLSLQHGLDVGAVRQQMTTAGEPEIGSINDVRLTPARSSSPWTRLTAWSSPRQVVTDIWRHKLASTVVVGLLVLAAATSLSYSNRVTALTDRDTILIADLVNSTGDPVFDGTLKQGLAVQLSQSPFLDIFPESGVAQTLRLMGRSITEPVTRDIAREIAQRRGLKAFVVGSIARFDRTYSIVLEAIAAESGESLTLTQIEAASRDQVLSTLSRAAAGLRKQLGESLTSIEEFDAPLEVTTSSLEALKAYTLGSQHANRGEHRAALPYFERAVELDSNFASAWFSRAIGHYNLDEDDTARPFAERAFALKGRLSEIENLRVTLAYHGLVTGDLQQAIAVSEIYRRTYPRDSRPLGYLSAAHLMLGQFEKALEESREGIRLNGDISAPRTNLASALLALGRSSEAKQVAHEALQRNLVAPELFSVLYGIALLEGDRQEMQRLLELTRERADEHVRLDWQGGAAASMGQWRHAQDLTRRAVDVGVQAGARELAARYAASGALHAAVLGACRDARPGAAKALALDRGYVSVTRSALALALCGDAGEIEPLVDELRREFPNHTLVNLVWLPTIRAARELQRGDGTLAAKELEAVRYEWAGELWPQYVRASVFLRKGDWSQAMAEFKKLIDRRGREPLSPLHALAQAGFASAARQSGDFAVARAAYERFLTLWKDADPTLPILLDAKAEYGKLRSS
jgi:serine/threonine protein kinase/tetratricopeptide (TPR) repeat protein